MCRSPRWALACWTGILVALAASGRSQPKPKAALGDSSPLAESIGLDVLKGDDKPADGPRPRASIVARVDNQIILLEEVISPVRAQLERAKKQVPPEKYREVEWNLLQQVTKSRIQRLVLLKELELSLPSKAAMPKIRQNLNEEFEKYLLKLARDAGLKTREEILEQINKEGSNLETLRNDYIDNMLAQIYLQKVVKPLIKEPTRDELMAYYLENPKEFSEEAGVRWRHIQVKKGTDPQVALAKAEDLRERLRAGADFALLAQEHSDGPTAAVGGEWQLTSKGSYADAAVDKMLFLIPENQISDVIEGTDAFHIIRVEKRNDGGPAPFAEVQDQIADKLTNQKAANLRKEKLQAAMDRHYIESIFDTDLETAGKPTEGLKR